MFVLVMKKTLEQTCLVYALAQIQRHSEIQKGGIWNHNFFSFWKSQGTW